jgi:hypothetical protein
MPNIDIELPEELTSLMEHPICVDMSFDKVKVPSIQLPSGGTIKGIADITKAIPTDCSLTFSLALQIAPLLANLACFVKLLKLIKPLIDVVDGLPTPPAKALKDFADAAVDLAPCLLIPTPACMIPFVKDILCLIIKLLKCLVQQLKSVAAIMGGLKLQLEPATAAGNTELEAALRCAQDNAAATAANAMSAIEPIKVLLELAGPFMGIAGVSPIVIPTFGDASDVESIQQVVATLEQVVEAMTLVADSLGGCD